jgi:hypothetical protein
MMGINRQVQKTKPLHRARLALLVAGALVSGLPLPAQTQSAVEPAVTGPYSSRTRVDWKARVLSIDIELDLAAAGLKLPEGRLQAERMIELDVAGLAKDAVLSLQADSWRTIEDRVDDGSFDSESLVALAGFARIERSSFSRDMRRFLATYSLSLDAIASLFLSGASPSPIRVPLESMPTRAYSGIVIYAKGPLPVHGEGVTGAAAPCLFPRIYDSNMNLILDASMLLPDSLAEGGVLGYASGIGVEAGERVGSDPMRVMALELFGDRRTDYVISREDALRILSSPGNRELLRQGRVVVVY